MTSKSRAPKKMSDELLRAQSRLDSACIRGETQSVIDDLRAQRDTVASKEKK
jgi:hypothetical protein